MTAAAAAVVDLALACYRAPLANQDRLAASAPLPEGMDRLLALANGSQDILEDAARHSGARPDEVRDASRFLVQQLCCVRGAGYYRLLGLEPGAPFDQIKEHHRQLMRLYHPDRAAGCETWTAGYAARINEAWTVLSRRESRADYDAHSLRPESQPEFRSAPAAVGLRPSRRPLGSLGEPSARPADRRPWRRRALLLRRLPMLVLGGCALVAVLAVWVIHLVSEPSALPAYTQVAAAITPPAPPSDLAAREADMARVLEQRQRIAQRIEAEQHRLEGLRVESAPTVPPPPAEPAVQAPPKPPSDRLVQPAVVPTVAAPIARVGPAVAASPAIVHRPDEANLTGRELDALVDRYTSAYHSADLDGVMALFAPDARGKDGSDRAGIRQVYGAQFAAFLVRGLEFRDLRWALHGNTASAVARYDLSLQGRRNGQFIQAAGTIRLKLRKRNGQVLIEAIDYDQSGK